MKLFSKITLGKIALLVLAILVTVLALADSGLAQSGVQKFERLVTRTLLVQKTATFQDAVTLSNGLTLDTGNLDMDANLITNIGNSGTDFASNGGLTTAAGITVTAGGVTLSDGNATVADFAILTPQTAISVTGDSIITPTGSYQPLESAGAVTGTLSSGCTAGQAVTFINTVAQTIIISETATSALSGNASLGQYDAIGVLCDGTRWVQVAPESDN